MRWKFGSDSSTKCVVYFSDGNERLFYSRDWKDEHSQTKDKELGLYRLRKMIGKFGSRARIAIIYDNISGQELEKYNEGILSNTNLNNENT